MNAVRCSVLIISCLLSFKSFAFLHDYDAYLDDLFGGNVTIKHDMQRGRFHKGGDLKITKLSLNSKQFIVSMRYTIIPKLLVPFPRKHRTGGIDQILPIEFATEEGYKLLEENGRLENNQAVLVFGKRESLGPFIGAYKIKVLPSSGKWSANIWFHGKVSSTGWLKIELTVKNIKLIGPYTIKSRLRGASF